VPLDPPEFAGSYRTVGIGRSVAVFGEGSANGAGAFSGTETRNVAGVLAPRVVDADFSVDPDGSLVWSEAPLFQSRFGALTRAGGMGAVQDAKLRVFLARAGSWSDASLAGVYRFVTFSVSVADVSSTAIGTLAFDGAGGLVATVESENHANSVTAVPGDVAGAYTVAADGDMTLTLGPFALEGTIGLGGEVVALAGGTVAGAGSTMMLMVKQQAGTGHDGLLAGRYEVVGHRYDDGVIFAESRIGATFTADGGGGGAWRSTIPNPFVPSPLPTPATTTVASDGLLDCSATGQDWRGAITSSGEVAILGGGITDGNRPAILVLIRKPDVSAPGELPLVGLDSGSVVDVVETGPIISITTVAEPIAFARRIRLISSSFLFGGAARGYMRFDLSSLPPGASIASATLVTYQDAVDGAPFDTGSVVLDHVDLGPGLDKDDDGAAPLPGGLLFATLSTSAAPGERAVDVTAAVQADLAGGRSTSDFRLRLIGAGTDTVGVVFDDHTAVGPTTGSRTRLRITLE
jgi:hypothetical protein